MPKNTNTSTGVSTGGTGSNISPDISGGTGQVQPGLTGNLPGSQTGGFQDTEANFNADIEAQRAAEEAERQRLEAIRIQNENKRKQNEQARQEEAAKKAAENTKNRNLGATDRQQRNTFMRAGDSIEEGKLAPKVEKEKTSGGTDEATRADTKPELTDLSLKSDSAQAPEPEADQSEAAGFARPSQTSEGRSPEPRISVPDARVESSNEPQQTDEDVQQVEAVAYPSAQMAAPTGQQALAVNASPAPIGVNEFSDIDFEPIEAPENLSIPSDGYESYEPEEARDYNVYEDEESVEAAATSEPIGFNSEPTPTNEEEPWTEDNRLQKVEQRKASIRANRAWFENQLFVLSGDGKDEDGNIVHSDAVQREINTTLKFFGGNKNEESTCLTAAMCLYGITPDRSERLFAKNNYKWEPVSDDMVIEALQMLRKNVLETGQPFAYTFSGKKRWYNSERFPLVPTNDVAKFLGNGRKGNRCKMAPSEIMKFSVNQFRKDNGVRDKIHYRAEKKQREVLLDAVDAIEQINGTNFKLSGRTGDPMTDGEVTLQDLFDWNYNPSTTSPEVLKWIENARKDAKNRAQAYLEAHDGSNRVLIKDTDGNIINSIEKNRNGFNHFWRVFSNYVRGLALLRPTLMIGAMPQHAVRNLEQKLSLYFTIGWNPSAGSFTDHISGFKKRIDNIKFSPEFYETLRRDDFKKAMDELLGGYAMGNRDVIQRYLADDKFRLGEMNIVGDLKKQMDGMTGWERFKFLADHKSTEFISVAAKLSSARWFMTNNDNKRFMEMLYWRFSESAPEQLSKSDFENMFISDPVGTLTQFAKTSEGNDAILFTLDNTISGMNVLSEPVQRLMSRNGLTSAGFMTFVSMFPTYGINMAASIFPMTRTANYIAARKIRKFSINHAEKKSEVGNKNQWQDLAIGGNVAELSDALNSQAGFWINLTLDLATFGVRTAAIGIVFLAFNAIGIEPPDDDDKKFVWGEWKIGGIPIEFNWWARDVFGVITPAAISLAAFTNGKMSAMESWTLFCQGMGETLAGTPWARAAGLYQSIAFFNDFEVNEKAAETEVYDRAFENYLAVAYESGLVGKEAADYAATNAEREVAEFEPDVFERYSTMFATWGLSTISNWIDIPVITDMYSESGWSATGNLARSTTMQYTPDPTDDADAVQSRDWADAQFAQVTRRNPVAAGIMNIISGLSGGTADYAQGDMPLQVVSDPINMTWYYRFQIYDNMTDQDKMAVCDDVIALIASVDDPQELAQNGVVIPYATQQATLDYIYANINKCYNEDYISFNESGVYNSNRNTADYNQILIDNKITNTQTEIDYLYELASRLKSNQIPKTAAKYNVWETNYSTRYEDAEGNPVTYVDWMLNPASEDNPDGVQRIMYASGDHRSATTPTLQVDQRYNTYDNQTPVSWQGPLTNIDTLEKYYSGATLLSGWFAGEDAFDILTGSGMVMSPVDNGWDSNTFVVGSRAWVPVDEYDDDYLLDPEREDAWNPLGTLGEKNAYSPSKYSSGYSRSYGGGSGGSSYNPKIYSNPAYSLSSDRPATMYSKIPYSTTFDYLRPEFETKGSREAYKRSDI